MVVNIVKGVLLNENMPFFAQPTFFRKFWSTARTSIGPNVVQRPSGETNIGAKTAHERDRARAVNNHPTTRRSMSEKSPGGIQRHGM